MTGRVRVMVTVMRCYNTHPSSGSIGTNKEGGLPGADGGWAAQAEGADGRAGVSGGAGIGFRGREQPHTALTLHPKPLEAKPMT